MLTASMRKLHKWIFTLVGVFMLLWTITGVIIALPVSMQWRSPMIDQTNAPDLSKHRVAPAEAIALLRTTEPQVLTVKAIELRSINNTLVYAVKDAEWSTHLVDAASGRRYRLSPETTESIVRQTFDVKEELATITFIDEHSYDYLWGELPVYRLQFDGAGSDIYYVSPTSGKAMHSNWLTRLGSLAMSLHDFGPIYTLTGSDAIRMLLMALIGGAAIAGSVTGLYLTLPRRWRLNRSS